jgi:RHS repeat-associated protein
MKLNINLKNISMLALVLILLTRISAYAQLPIELKRYVCADATSSEFIYDGITAPESEGDCGTSMHLRPTGDAIYNAVNYERLDGGPHRVKVMVDWKPNTTGRVSIEVYYTRKQHTTFKCKDEDQKYLYTYVIEKGSPNPGGYLSVPNDIISSNATSFPEVDLTYYKDAGYTEDVQQMRWSLNDAFQGTRGFLSQGSDNFHLRFTPTHFGAYVITTESINFCNEWLPGPSKTIHVNPTCYKDDLSRVSFFPMGPDITFYEDDGSYGVSPNQDYQLSIDGLTDFSDNYDISSDGGADVVLNGTTFSVTQPIGGYHITITPKADKVGICPTPLALSILVGGTGAGTPLADDCGIVLPRDIGDLGYDIDPSNPIFQHFTFTVSSKKNIVVMPGINLALGAELELEQPDPVATGDADMNFTEATHFNEYGQVLSNARTYFDDNGKSLQSQYMDLTSGILFANATLYDAFDRPAITTLPAPLSFVTTESAVDACGDPLPNNEQLEFSFKSDFVKAAEAEARIYNYQHFDNASDTEFNPVPIAATEGTLGWYYSSNNTDEPLVARTEYPYSRILYQHDGSGEVKSVTKPGDAFKAGSSYVATSDKTIVTLSDPYLTKYLTIRESKIGLTNGPVEGQFFKSIFIDEEGKKSETYSDKGGKTIISLYYGDQSNPITKSYQFFDLTGRLLVSVSPNGVEAYERTTLPVDFSLIDKTKYFYNSKGQLSAVEETDAGRTEYVYRKDGSIRFSQNAKQRCDNPPCNDAPRYSYTNYDNSGRPIESGEYVVGAGDVEFKTQAMTDILENTSVDGGLNIGVKRDRVFSFYDEPVAVPGGRVQRFVNGAVSYSRNDHVTTYYSYDETGRVEWMVQDILALGVKTIDYRYGPTGAVQEVLYQKGNATDQFSHFYLYDADGRLSRAYTSTAEIKYTQTGEVQNPGELKLQATYHYYQHGPLKRIELAGNLQGIDYVYTADGALKSINSANPASDPGTDGSGDHAGFRADVFGMSLDYYNGDYTGAGSRTDQATISALNYPEQHNGQIRAMRWHSPIETDKQFVYAYLYDNRNQFKQADWGTIVDGNFTNNIASTHIPSTNRPDSYQESISGYDLNGNINTLNRKNSVADNIANFKYVYTLNTNQLDKILNLDDESKVIKDYTYTPTGELESEIGESGEPEKHITYNVSGKVSAVYRDALKTKLAADFTYDDRGFRLSKTGYDDEGAPKSRTWYVRDASGTVMATYEQDLDESEPLRLTELPVYASGRIGFYKPEFDFYMYELTDHLGNVRAVIGNTITQEYLATMETERADIENNDFIRLGNDPSASDFNHTAEVITVNGVDESIADPNEVDRLNNMPTNGEPTDPIGTGMQVWVHPGDVIEVSVFVNYTDFNASNQGNIPLSAAILGSAFAPVPVGIDGSSIFSTVDESDFALWPAWDNLDDEQPRAFLNCLLFDNDGKLQLFDFDQVTSAAKIVEAAPHEELHLQFTVKKEGLAYIFVSNHADQNTEVYFDDLRVKHTYSDIVAGGDFYPYGLAIKDRQIQRDFYRHGYQGQFSEKDEETGWNYFEAREYDPAIGRWLMRDPSKQHPSPYLAFSNDPVNRLDPDGKWDFGEKVKNWLRFREFLTNAEFDTKYFERINVFIWEKTSDKDVGHTALEVDGVVYGYYPTDVNGNGVYDKGDLNNSIGELHIDTRVDFNSIYTGDKVNSYSIKVTPAQKAAVLANLGEVKLHPGTYTLIGMQCTSTAMSVMAKADIKITDAGGGIDRFNIGVAPKAFEAMLNNALNSFLVAAKTSFIVKP